MLLALSWGGRKFDWISLPTGALLLGSAVLWGLFGWRLMRAQEPFLPLTVLGNPVVRCSALAGACAMATLVGMTIFVPLYFEVVLHLSASQSGLALIPLMGSTVTLSTFTGRAMMHVVHYKRMPFVGVTISILCLGALAVWPASMPIWGVLVLLAVIGAGLGSLFPISTVCMQNAVVQSQMGIATATANFFRALFSALVVAILGAIVLGGLGGATGVAGGDAGARLLAAYAGDRVPLRVPRLRAGARLRHDLPAGDGGARAARAFDALAAGRRPDRAGDADPGIGRGKRPAGRTFIAELPENGRDRCARGIPHDARVILA